MFAEISGMPRVLRAASVVGGLAALGVLGLGAGVASASTVTFNTAGIHSFDVPSNVAQITVTAVGAAGGSCSPYAGGRGATVTGTVPVSPGESLSVVVGGVGADGCGSGTGVGVGGVGGGGTGGASPDDLLNGSGGGGASGVGSSGIGATTGALVVAGGGGGAAVVNGGDAGSPGGSSALSGGGTGGGAGTVTGPGAGGTGGTSGSATGNGSNGAGGSPGAGGNGGNAGAPGPSVGGGGGGGGYYGGGGGGGSASFYCCGGGGGGGASFTAPGATGVSPATPTSNSAMVEISYTAAPAPTVTTGGATAITPTSATLHGTVNPNGLGTTYDFEYGTTTAYGHQTKSQSAGSGTSTVDVSQQIKGLTPGTTYHYRLVATSASGSAEGQDETFTTPAAALKLAVSPRRTPAGTRTCFAFTATSGGHRVAGVTVQLAGHTAHTSHAGKATICVTLRRGVHRASATKHGYRAGHARITAAATATATPAPPSFTG